MFPTNRSPSAKHRIISPMQRIRESSYRPRFQARDVLGSQQKIVLKVSRRPFFIRKVNLEA